MDEIIVHVLPSAYAQPHTVYVQMSYDIWGKPGVVEAIGKAVQATFDKPASETKDE